MTGFYRRVRSHSAVWFTSVLLASALPAGLGGCAGEAADPGAASATQNDLLAVPAPGTGVQYAMDTELEAGIEVERCKFVQAPAAGMLVNRDEVRFTAGSHHVLLYETPYSSIPTMKDDGTAVDTRDVFDCSDGASNGWSVTKLIGGSQNGQGESLLAFPPGIAVRVRPNTVLLIDAHYINTSAHNLEARVRINLHTLAERELREEGDLLFLYNPVIKVPAGGSSRARMRCPVYQDVTIANVQSHMHARGVGYAAMIEGEEPFYTNDRWENVPVATFEDGLHVAAGQRLDYYCDYQNPSDRDVYQGPRSTDEMCMLIGSYYPANLLGQCKQANGEGSAEEWVGEGDASCAETLQCLANVPASDDHGDLRSLTDCMLRSKAEVAGVLSAAFRCMSGAQQPQVTCATELAACRAE